MTNERLAGFGKEVVQAARTRDQVAREIVAQAGVELGQAAVAVIRGLKLEHEQFVVAYVGGVFAAAGELILDPMREVVKALATRAFLAEPRFPPAVAAARMARAHVNQMALAG
jgi:N-acetylglucosamine kinase-like BadF-type ATPase